MLLNVTDRGRPRKNLRHVHLGSAPQDPLPASVDAKFCSSRRFRAGRRHLGRRHERRRPIFSRPLDRHESATPRRFDLGFVVIVLCTAFILLSSPVALGAGDPAAGQKIFVRCAGCHSIVAGENKNGPSLAGVFGRKSGAEPGFNYSPALKSANITWDENTLDKYLANPSALVHGTRMFINVPNAEDRENVISYLETLGK
jgi:cytochrome c